MHRYASSCRHDMLQQQLPLAALCPRSTYSASPEVFECMFAQVWRVEWNVVGSVLASSGDDGSVMLWKQDLLVRPWLFSQCVLCAMCRPPRLLVPLVCHNVPPISRVHACVTGQLAMHSNAVGTATGRRAGCPRSDGAYGKVMCFFGAHESWPLLATSG
jgi:hypothetical protein